MNIVLSLFNVRKQMLKLAAATLQQRHPIASCHWNMLFFQETGKQGIRWQIHIGCIGYFLKGRFFLFLRLQREDTTYGQHPP